MKTFYHLIAAFLLSFYCVNGSAQTAPKIIWGHQYGSAGAEYVHNHLTDSHGNIYVSGNTTGSLGGDNRGMNDGFIVKTDSKGNVLWKVQFGTVGNEDVQWSAIDRNGNIYVTGSTTGDMAGKSHGREDIFVVKYSSGGKQMWCRQFGTDSTDVARGIYVDEKECIYLAGVTSGKLGTHLQGGMDGFVMKLNAAGEVLFTTQIGTEGYDGCDAITGDGKGNIYVCGTTFGKLGAESRGMLDVFAATVDEKGTVKRTIQFGTPSFDVATSVMADSAGNLYVGGSTAGDFAGTQAGEGDCFLTKIGMDGSLLWSKQFGTAKNDGVKAIVEDRKHGNILVSGLMNLPPARAFVRMYTKDGTLLWEKIIAPENTDGDASGKDVSVDDRGNIIHVGLTQWQLFDKQQGESDFYIVKMTGH
jgi:hypothetical protein